jgi:hypothetical protein
MSLLKRPDSVEFDPSNKEHRLAVRAFLKRRAWADSPLKFTHDPNFGSVADQVQTKLLLWYSEQEEAREAKRAAKKAEADGGKGQPAEVPRIHRVA